MGKIIVDNLAYARVVKTMGEFESDLGSTPQSDGVQVSEPTLPPPLLR